MSSDARLRLLVVTGDDTTATQLLDALNDAGAGTFVTEREQRAEEAIVALASGGFDLVLVDVDPTASRGVDDLGLIATTTADTALLAVTSDPDPEIAILALQHGAQECLIRGTDDLSPERLARSIRDSLVRTAHDSSRPLASLIELSADPIITVNRDRVVTRYNHAAERLYGIRAEEILGTVAIELHDPDLRAEQIAFLDRILDGNSIPPFETKRRHADGHEMIISVTGTPVKDAFGNVIEVCAIIRDVTVEATARERLERHQLWLEATQAAGHIGSWSVNVDTGEIAWSAEHFRLLKRDPNEGPVPLPELASSVHPDDRELVARHFYSRSSFNLEARLIADPADVRVLAIQAQFVPGEDGRHSQLFGITRDVTEERAEQAARHVAEEQVLRSFNEALIGMAIIDLDRTCIVRTNDALSDILGYTREEFLATTIQAITHPDDKGDDVPVVELLISGAQKHHVREKRYIHADGRTIWAEVGVSLVTDASGNPMHWVTQVQDITERRQHIEQLRHLADHDPLTGLYNRRGFDHALTTHIAHVQRYENIGALMLIDLDNFKHHNDVFGHAAGDQLLIELSDALRTRLRTTDVIGRLGGDEFAVLLPDATRTRADMLAQTLIDHIRETTDALNTAAQAGVTASIGVVCFETVGPLAADEVMQCADVALYGAKAKGRNSYVEYLPDSIR